MPLSNTQTAHINTIPITSVAGDFTYTFQMEESSAVQILWAQFTFSTDATVGSRRPLFIVQDELGNNIVVIQYFNNLGANTSTIISFVQGNTIIPTTVVGSQIGIPANGVFVKNNWVLRIFSLQFFDPGDSFVGHFQTKGLHNSVAPN